MLIHYRGGRNHLRVTYGRRMFHFTSANKFVLDITEQKVRDYIFKLPNSFEFEAIEREYLKEVDTLKKDVKKGAKHGQEEL